jgi:triphosphoribosyl-dephospho-CoA synthase
MPRLSEAETRELFLAACRAEIGALKPGNVHIHAGGHGMEVRQFEASAAAAAPWIADGDLRIGARIRHAVDASFAAAGCNTNLGILLLAAPLAAAAQSGDAGTLRDRLATVIAALDAKDTADVYAAIRRANPGGLGADTDQDVSAAPTVGLLTAMALAAHRDRIARAYVSNFAEVFEFGLPTLDRVRPLAHDSSLMVTTLHMAYLAELPDSHIARKFGNEVAEQVRKEALRHKPLWTPAASPGSFAELFAFDTDLKRRNLNPGTTADFVVATLFAASIRDRMALSSLA